MKFFKKKITYADKWWTVYKELNLCDGKLECISDNGQDMLEITYKDGMFIDVGECSNIYYITVVSSNDEMGWRNPLCIIAVNDKKDLVEKIQETILKFRLAADNIK